MEIPRVDIHIKVASEVAETETLEELRAFKQRVLTFAHGLTDSEFKAGGFDALLACKGPTDTVTAPYIDVVGDAIVAAAMNDDGRTAWVVEGEVHLNAGLLDVFESFPLPEQAEARKQLLEACNGSRKFDGVCEVVPYVSLELARRMARRIAFLRERLKKQGRYHHEGLLRAEVQHEAERETPEKFFTDGNDECGKGCPRYVTVMDDGGLGLDAEEATREAIERAKAGGDWDGEDGQWGQMPDNTVYVRLDVHDHVVESLICELDCPASVPLDDALRVLRNAVDRANSLAWKYPYGIEQKEADDWEEELRCLARSGPR